MRYLLIALLLAAAFARAEDALPVNWRVIVPLDKKSLAVRADGKGSEVSKDAAVFPKRPEMLSAQRNIVVQKDRGVTQLFLHNPRARGLKQLTKHERDCREVQVHPKSAIVAYTVEELPPAGRRMKWTPRNLHLLHVDTGESRVVCKQAHVMDFVWSPDGKTLAVSRGSSVEFYDGATGKLLRGTKTIDIDKRLYAHGAHFLLWRPDGKEVACNIQFLGGRIAIEGRKSKPIYGDHQLFFVPLNGPVRAVDLPVRAWVRPCAWVR